MLYFGDFYLYCYSNFNIFLCCRSETFNNSTLYYSRNLSHFVDFLEARRSFLTVCSTWTQLLLAGNWLEADGFTAWDVADVLQTHVASIVATECSDGLEGRRDGNGEKEDEEKLHDRRE